MMKYKWLMWRQKRAIRIFEMVKKSLADLAMAFQMEIGNSLKRIDEHKQEIEKENEAIEFLNSQLAITNKRVLNVSAIIDPQ